VTHLVNVHTAILAHAAVTVIPGTTETGKKTETRRGGGVGAMNMIVTQIDGDGAAVVMDIVTDITIEANVNMKLIESETGRGVDAGVRKKRMESLHQSGRGTMQINVVRRPFWTLIMPIK
jgi:hypothetical protein